MSSTTLSAPDADLTAPAAASQRASNRVMGADGVRALAALGVIFSHLFQRFNPWVDSSQWYVDLYAVMLHGAMGVSAFFVLSGMLLALPFWTAYLTGGPMPSLRHFARRRFARIAPGYWVALTVAVVVGLMVTPDAQYVWWRYLTGMTFTSGFHYKTLFPSEVNGPLWSISFEVWSYVLLPIVLAGLFVWRLLRRRATDADVGPGRAWVAGLYWAVAYAVVVVVNGVLVTQVQLSDELRGWDFGQIGGAKHWMPGYNPLGFFGHFMLGVGAALAIVVWRVKKDAVTRWWWDAIAAGGFVAAAVLVWLDRDPAEPDHTVGFQQQPFLYPWFAACVAVILVGLAHSRLLGRLVDNRFARYTATVSFGLYIWHYTLIILLSWGLGGGFEYASITDRYRHLAVSLVVLLAAYAIATVSWRYLERPVLESRWARGAARRSERSRGGTGSAAAQRADDEDRPDGERSQPQ